MTALPATTTLPDSTAFPRCFVDGQGLTGEEGLVDLEPAVHLHAPVRHHLVARAQLEHVVHHHLLHGQLDALAVAHGMCTGSGEHGQPIEGPLGPQLLDDADGGVDHQDQGEHSVLDRPHNQNHHEERPQDGVEPGGHVGPQDLGHRPPAGGGHRVDLARRHPGGHLLAGQAHLGRDGFHGADSAIRHQSR